MKMSKILDYDEVSTVYDRDRAAVGVDVIAGLIFIHGGKPLKDLKILDAGCGTGHYAKALLDLGVKKMAILDSSSEMLNIAKEKLKSEIEKGTIMSVVEATMPPIPFSNGIFDAVLFNHVLQHLDDPNNNNSFPEIERVFHEAKRILKPNGFLIVSTEQPSIAREAVWFAQLESNIIARYSKRLPSLKQLETLFEKTGFRCAAKLNILGAGIFSNYWDPEGPLKKEWRKGMNVFEQASQSEIKEMERKVLELKEEGTLLRFIEETDRTQEFGLTSVILCVSI